MIVYENKGLCPLRTPINNGLCPLRTPINNGLYPYKLRGATPYEPLKNYIIIYNIIYFILLSVISLSSLSNRLSVFFISTTYSF